MLFKDEFLKNLKMSFGKYLKLVKKKKKGIKKVICDYG